MSNDAIIAIAVTAGMVLFFLVICLPDILKTWQGAKGEAAKTEADAANIALKREMVAKGFSADEIARVINGGSGDVVKSEGKPLLPAERS